MKIRYFLLALFIPFMAGAQNSQWQWAVSQANSGIGLGNDIARDAAGSIYIAGIFKNALDFGSFTLTSAGSDDIFIAKYDPSGQLQWAVRAGGTGEDDMSGLCIDDAGNIYVTGGFQGSADFGPDILTSNGLDDIYLIKLDPAGNFVWTKGWGGIDNDMGTRLHYSVAGNIYLTGYATDNVNFGSVSISAGTSQDALVLKIDTAGQVFWARNAGSTNLSALGASVFSDASEDVYITGVGTASNMYFGTVITSNTDAFVAKYDNQGNIVWAKSIQGLGNYAVYGTPVITDQSNNVYVGGFSYHDQAFGFGTVTVSGDRAFLAKYNSAGSLLWAKKIGANNQDAATCLALDNENNIYVGGSFVAPGIFGQDTLTALGGKDILVVKFDSNGNHLWATNAGGPYDDVAYGIALDHSGGIFVTGAAVGPALEFGPVMLNVPPGNGMDMFVAKLAETTGVPVLTGNDRNIVVYPNPVNGLLYVSTREKLEYRVLTITGSVVAGGILQEGMNNISTENMPTGLYLLHTGSGVYKFNKK